MKNSEMMFIKALQKADTFIVLCLTKYETIQLSKFETNRKFHNRKILAKLYKIIHKSEM